mgnify:FL=1
MDWSDTGFVVAKGLFREADVWLRILFRGHGMQTVFAFGGAHSRRRFVGCLDVMNILTCRVSPSRRGTYLDLEEAVLEKGPERLRHSPALLGIAANCLKFTRAVGVPEQSGEEGFRLLSEMLARLESGDAPSVLFPLFFRLRLAGILGYAPGFDICASCGRPVEGAGRFSVEEARVLCEEGASRSRGGGIVLSAKALDVLRDVQQEYPLSWPASGLSPQDRRQTAQAIDAFVQYHLGFTWERGRFLRV